MVTGCYVPEQRLHACLHKEKWSNQNKCALGGRAPLTALEETKLFRRFLSETILFAFIHHKDSYNQHRHGSVISISFMQSASLPTCSASSHKAPSPNYPQEHPHATLLHLCILSQCDM